MKKLSKTLLTVASLATCLGLTACGGSEPSVKNVYNAEKNIALKGPQGMPQFGSLTVTVYSDGSYMLCDEVYTVNISYNEESKQMELGSEFGQFGVIARGTYTETAGEDSLTLKLSKPTSVVYSGSVYGGAMGVFYYNTDDKDTFVAEEGADTVVTAEMVLATVSEYTVTVDTRDNRITDGVQAGYVAMGVFAGLSAKPE